MNAMYELGCNVRYVTYAACVGWKPRLTQCYLGHAIVPAKRHLIPFSGFGSVTDGRTDHATATCVAIAGVTQNITNASYDDDNDNSNK